MMSKKEPSVSLPTFIDFVCALGTAKITKVRVARDRYGRPYEPAQDYYKGLREKLCDVLRDGSGASGLRGFVPSVHAKKTDHYNAAVKGFRKFLAKHEVSFSGDITSAYWSEGGLEVKVNPELLLVVDGQTLVVKLHFKEEPLSAHRAQTSLQLLHETHGDIGTAAILDVRRGTLYKHQGFPGVAALLRGEATSFAAIWVDLGKRAA
jgi:hypothetical protein